MVFTDIIFSLLIAIMVTSLFVWLKFRKERRIWEKRIWPFFLAIFLATWATSIWITPNGLVAAQYAWIPMFVAGIILAIVITTFLPAESEKGLDIVTLLAVTAFTLSIAYAQSGNITVASDKSLTADFDQYKTLTICATEGLNYFSVLGFFTHSSVFWKYGCDRR